MRLFALLLLSSFALPAAAAESYDACVGFIDAVPATLTTQGVWCLRKDLATSVTSGAAITIAANNITVDCNGFKLGGLGAGQDSLAAGVSAMDRLNATVRHCNIRGFHTGVRLVGQGGGHLVEDNRIDQSLRVGIRIDGDGNLVQRNRVFDTGVAGESASGIQAEGDILDNTVDGLVGEDATGIYVGGQGSEVRHNRVRNAVPTSSVNGIITFGAQISMVDNRVVNVDTGGSMPASSVAIIGSGDTTAFCRDNLVAGYQTGVFMCEDNGGNVVHGASP